MALMNAQLNQLDTKLGTFESTVNARLAALEEGTASFRINMLAMGEVMDRAALHGNVIAELEESDLRSHNEIGRASCRERV